MRTRVCIVEDSEKIRESLAILIDGSEGFACAGAFGSAEEALREIPTRSCDIVLMDINLPKMSGIECLRKLRETAPTLQVLMHTVYDDAEALFDSLKAGASGYLLKRTPPAKLLEAIHEVRNGGSPMSGPIARMVVQHFRERPAQKDDSVALTEREEEILGYLARGHRYKEIADAAGISFDTVRSHLRSIYEKLHVTSRTEAVVKFLKR